MSDDASESYFELQFIIYCFEFYKLLAAKKGMLNYRD